MRGRVTKQIALSLLILTLFECMRHKNEWIFDSVADRWVLAKRVEWCVAARKKGCVPLASFSS